MSSSNGYDKYKRWREKQKELGRCIRCGKPREEGNKNRCNKCIEKMRSYNRISSKRRIERRRKEGVCTRCGKKRPYKGKAKCYVCLEVSRRYYRKHRRKHKREGSKSRRSIYLDPITRPPEDNGNIGGTTEPVDVKKDYFDPLTFEFNEDTPFQFDITDEFTPKGILFEPTTARPGTDEKVAVIEQRYELGLPLWHPDDEKIPIRPEDKSDSGQRGYRKQGYRHSKNGEKNNVGA